MVKDGKPLGFGRMYVDNQKEKTVEAREGCWSDDGTLNSEVGKIWLDCGDIRFEGLILDDKPVIGVRSKVTGDGFERCLTFVKKDLSFE